MVDRRAAGIHPDLLVLDAEEKRSVARDPGDADCPIYVALLAWAIFGESLNSLQ